VAGGLPPQAPAAHRLRRTTKVGSVGATEVDGVPIPPGDRVWRHPSEVGQAQRLRRRRRRRAMLVATVWAVLLVAAVTVGYGAVTD